MNIDTQTSGAKPHPNLVAVKVDGDPRMIPPGDYTGASLKKVLNIPLEHVLELVRHHKFEPIDNGEKIKIKGGEEFVTHCGQGQSS